MGGYRAKGIMSLEDSKKFLTKIRNQMPRGSMIVETESYAYNMRDYIVFPRPATVSIDQESCKDNSIISHHQVCSPRRAGFYPQEDTRCHRQFHGLDVLQDTRTHGTG